MELTKTQKRWTIAGGILLLMFISLGAFAFRSGKKTKTLSDPTLLPGDETGETNHGASNDELKQIVTQLYDDMSGFNAMGHNMEPYKRAMALDDDDLMKLYNAFNAKYEDEDEGTLYEWIEDEKYSFFELTDLLLERMSKLNLK